MLFYFMCNKIEQLWLKIGEIGIFNILGDINLFNFCGKYFDNMCYFWL